MTELFENFEVNRESRATILMRLIGASLVVHLVFVWMVVYVPAVRDTVNIAALIASTKWVDEEYTATQIGSDVQIVQLEKFRYPDGYFALENQGFVDPAVAGANDPFAPKIISQWKAGGPDPEDKPSPSPEASPSASPAANASPSPAIAQNNAGPAGSPGASPSASPGASPAASPLTQEDAQKELEKTAAQNNVTLPDENQINKRALKDFAAFANELKNQGKLDLNKPFEIVIEAQLDEKGKLVNPKFTKQEGDANLVDLFGRMISALNDSGFLTYLSPISKDNPGSTVRIMVKQGDKEVLASVESETTSPERAKSLASVLNNLLFFGAGSRAGKDEEVIMKNTNAMPDGKKVVVNFSMPRQNLVDMIKKQMQPGA